MRRADQKKWETLRKILDDNLPGFIDHVQRGKENSDASAITDQDCMNFLQELLSFYQSRLSRERTERRQNGVTRRQRVRSETTSTKPLTKRHSRRTRLRSSGPSNYSSEETTETEGGPTHPIEARNCQHEPGSLSPSLGGAAEIDVAESNEMNGTDQTDETDEMNRDDEMDETGQMDGDEEMDGIHDTDDMNRGDGMDEIHKIDEMGGIHEIEETDIDKETDSIDDTDGPNNDEETDGIDETDENDRDDETNKDGETDGIDEPDETDRDGETNGDDETDGMDERDETNSDDETDGMVESTLPLGRYNTAQAPILQILPRLQEGIEEEVATVAYILDVLKSQKLSNVTMVIFPEHDVNTISQYLQGIGKTGALNQAMINCQNTVVNSETCKGVVNILTMISKVTFINWYDSIKS